MSQSSIAALIQPVLRVLHRFRPQIVSPTAISLVDNYMLHIQTQATFEYHTASILTISDLIVCGYFYFRNIFGTHLRE